VGEWGEGVNVKKGGGGAVKKKRENPKEDASIIDSISI